MDPDETLNNIREIIRIVDPAKASCPQLTLELMDLAKAVAALDKWLSNGGFLPKAWVKGQ